MKKVDMVILSWAKDMDLLEVTENCIWSCLGSEDPKEVEFHFYIIESNPEIHYDFPFTETIHPNTEFGYNKFMNIGISKGNSEYVCLCNNDLTFEKNWASNIIRTMESHPHILSSSPWCPQTQKDNSSHLGKIYLGHRVRVELAGWCIFQQRKIYEKIEKLNEGVNFWYSDNIYADQLLKHNISHALIPNSVVNHHEYSLGKTGNTLDEKTKNEYMQGQLENYLKARKEL